MISIIPELNDLNNCVEFAEKNSLGFEYNDFFKPYILDDKDELKRRIDIYKSLNRPYNIDTLHGVFYDMIHFSLDEKIRNHSIYRMQQSIEVAEELGCKGVIFHTNISPSFAHSEWYTNEWLGKSILALKKLLKCSSNVEIYFENMLDDSPEYLFQLSESMKDEKRFGICLDIAHLMVMSRNPELWFQKLAPFIKHFHFNDNNLVYDEHMTMGKGRIDWKHISSLLKQYNLFNENVSKLIEVRGLQSAVESLKYIRDNNLFL